MSDAAVLLPFRSLPPSLPCLLLAKSSPKPLLLPGLRLVVDCKTQAEAFLGFKQLEGLSTTFHKILQMGNAFTHLKLCLAQPSELWVNSALEAIPKKPFSCSHLCFQCLHNKKNRSWW